MESVRIALIKSVLRWLLVLLRYLDSNWSDFVYRWEWSPR